MKQKKMVTLTLVNGLLLLVFASFLSSCQKSSIKATGHFTSKIQSRAVASSAPGTIDPRQIFVYCSVSSPDSESCYTKKVKRLGVNTLKSYPALKVEVSQVANSIISSLSSSLDKQVEKRRDFCLKNANYFFDKCMNQYVERDSMGTLNAYYEKNPSITGYEYLYLKETISKAYSAKLQIEMNSIEEFQKKKYLNQFDDLGVEFLTQNHSWINNVYSMNQSLKVCKSLLSKKVNIPLSNINNNTFNEKCIEVIAHKTVNRALNIRLYDLAEHDFKKMELALRGSTNLKKDLTKLISSKYYHQKENLELFYKRLRKTRSIASKN